MSYELHDAETDSLFERGLAEECQGCGRLFEPEELFDGLCESCALEVEGDELAEQAPFGDHLEWTFVRDERL